MRGLAQTSAPCTSNDSPSVRHSYIQCILSEAGISYKQNTQQAMTGPGCVVR